MARQASESPFSRAMGYRVGARECTGDTNRASKKHGRKVKERKGREINSRSRCIAQFACRANQFPLFTHWSSIPTFYTPELFAATSPFRRCHCINGNDIQETRIHALRIPKFIPTDKMPRSASPILKGLIDSQSFLVPNTIALTPRDIW
jgi:hypothetical protein